MLGAMHSGIVTLPLVMYLEHLASFRSGQLTVHSDSELEKEQVCQVHCSIRLQPPDSSEYND